MSDRRTVTLPRWVCTTMVTYLAASTIWHLVRIVANFIR